MSTHLDYDFSKAINRIWEREEGYRLDAEEAWGAGCMFKNYNGRRCGDSARWNRVDSMQTGILVCDRHWRKLVGFARDEIEEDTDVVVVNRHKYDQLKLRAQPYRRPATGKQKVYVIAGEHGLVKIGISNNVQRRLKDLENGSGLTLELVQEIEVEEGEASGLERFLHDRFNKHRKKGEWFQLPVGTIPFPDDVVAEYRDRLGGLDG